MPPPTPLQITPYRWIQHRRSRALIEILGALNASGGRDLVAIVDSSEVEHNATFIEWAPIMYRDAWTLLDAIDAAGVTPLIQLAADALRATLVTAAT